MSQALPLPSITVIIPVFNRAGTLPVALKSVLDQTDGRWELVIADDGSTDNTTQVLEPFLKDPRIRYVAQENEGVSAARNLGAANAHTEYLFFLDSDDVMREGTIEIINRTISERHADVLFCSCRMIKDGVSTIKAPADLGKIFSCVHGLFLAGAFCIRKRTFLDAGGYKVGLKFSENYELGIRVCQLPVKSVVIDHLAADYVIQTQKRTSNSLENRLHSNLYILQAHNDLLKTDRRYHSGLLSQTGYLCQALGRRREARLYYKKSFIIRPVNLRNMYRFLTSFF